MRRLKRTGIIKINYQIKYFSIKTFFILFALNFVPLMCQDGSSEITLDKTILGTKVRVRCTDDNLKLYPNATACADEREPESCRMVFTISSSNSPAARDPKCDNPLLKDLANQCRHTCAICCEDPSYACQNDESGIVNCDQNMEKCGSPEFSTMMIKFCPATCGLCLAKRCRDQIEECETMKSFCSNEIYSTFMEHQCARTCGKCRIEGDFPNEEEFITTIIENRKNGQTKSGESIEIMSEKSEELNALEEEKIKESAKSKQPKRGRPKIINSANGKKIKNVKEKCIDIWRNCKKNKRFCKHESYINMMKQNCAKTCGFCKPTKAERERKQAIRNVDPECQDSHLFCKGWAANGYCESEKYTDEEKQEKCEKTCGYC